VECTKELIAPCGINCSVCSGFLRKKNPCGGCLTVGLHMPTYCATCRIKFCEEHDNASFTYCYECKKFPCVKIKKLHKRYSGKYHLNLIGNSEIIRDEGMKSFLAKESKKWTCAQCGAVLCVHKEACMTCGSNSHITGISKEGGPS
jgi:hypothetical protein